MMYNWLRRFLRLEENTIFAEEKREEKREKTHSVQGTRQNHPFYLWLTPLFAFPSFASFPDKERLRFFNDCEIYSDSSDRESLMRYPYKIYACLKYFEKILMI